MFLAFSAKMGNLVAAIAMDRKLERSDPSLKRIEGWWLSMAKARFIRKFNEAAPCGEFVHSPPPDPSAICKRPACGLPFSEHQGLRREAVRKHSVREGNHVTEFHDLCGGFMVTAEEPEFTGDHYGPPHSLTAEEAWEESSGPAEARWIGEQFDLVLKAELAYRNTYLENTVTHALRQQAIVEVETELMRASSRRAIQIRRQFWRMVAARCRTMVAEDAGKAKALLGDVRVRARRTPSRSALPRGGIR